MSTDESADTRAHVSLGKPAEVAFWFWVIRIAAATLGETGGDAAVMSMNLGSDSDESAQELLHHEDVKVTKRVYRRKVPTGTPLPSAIGGRGEG